jgi:hypothetical protein
MIPIPVLLAIAASLSLAKTFYNRIVEPSSFFSSTFCLTYLHVAYNKQKMDLLYPTQKGGKEHFYSSKSLKKLTIKPYFLFEESPSIGYSYNILQM